MIEFDQKDYPNLSEEVLFNRYRGGDTKAFDHLLERTQGLVYSQILRYFKKRQQADEIFQEVFFKVCRNKDQFRESVSFKSWLVTIARNTCIDHLRKKQRTPFIESLDNPEDDQRSLSETLPDAQLAPDEIANLKLEDSQVAALLQQLPEEQSETFFMKVMQDLTFEEIGQAMNCSANTAKSRYRYAVSSLQALVKRREFLRQVV
ncbi:MAG: sigma-70 family RNA polymerase sigma factor [Deltaproteobacteria bacterium]|nr:sigma-70 family RNA polymerase sigma factor [Deltaproteobacteria bacterium]